jgi:aspartyl-tRNA(Asn)/glutamyl-tRNA(Gln) amidotransferase subunit A
MDDIIKLSLTQLRDALSTRRVSARDVYLAYLGRIHRHNKTLNAYLTVLEEPVPSADGYKLPIAIKDNFCTAGVRTTASAKVLDTFVPPYESTVTDRLWKSGMSLIGKTNMDAWAHGSSTETSDYGPSLNPWDISKAPGGSSGGSAVVVAAGLAPAAIGSETAGSIRLPAAWCGIVGLKPTYGRVSRYGVIAMGSSLDCPGPMTRTVEDAAYILEVIAGRDPFDATSSPIPTDVYVRKLREKKTFTIGVAEEYMKSATDEARASIEQCLKLFTQLGHKIKHVRLLNPTYSISVYTIIQRAEVSSNLARYDGIRYGLGRDAFGAEAKRRIMLGTYTLAHGYYDAFYKKAQKVRTLIIDDFQKAFRDVDVIVAPTTPTTAIKLGEFEKYPFFGEQMDLLSEPSSMAGLPAITVPSGLGSDGMPLGMQIIGPQFEETRVLQLAKQYEDETSGFDGIATQQLSKWA